MVKNIVNAIVEQMEKENLLLAHAVSVSPKVAVRASRR